MLDPSSDRDTLCTLCTSFAKDVEITTSSNVDVPLMMLSDRWKEPRFFRHVESFDELVARAKTGCDLCNLLADDFAEQGANGTGPLKLHLFPNDRPVKFLATFEEEKYAWWYWGAWEPHVFYVVKNRPYDPLMEAKLDADGNVVGKPDKFHRATPKRSDAKETFDTARLWLKTCVESHPKCSQRLRHQLPTRIIYVGEPPAFDEVPRLITDTTGKDGSYVALSHCWGGNIPCVLTTKILDDYRGGLPVLQLPRNFLDAIHVTRELGFSYLWIDALCIIQDSDTDWKTQAGKMASYYSNAAVTITALNADASTKGFLGDRVHRHVKISRDLSVREEDTCIVDLLEACALEKRGWCMQERMLAPALLHFSDEQIIWECQEGITLEQSGMVVYRNLRSQRQQLKDFLISRFISLRRDYNLGAIPAGFENWYMLIEEFSRRRLTFESDTLPAIAGIASRFRELVGKGTYMAGLWEEDLRGGLFWGAKSRSQTREVDPIKRDFYILSRPEERARRFPSWSWASVSGRVEFLLPSEEQQAADDKARQDFKILSVDPDVGLDDLMASEVKCTLRLRAPIARIRYEAPAEKEHAGSGYFCRDDKSGELEDFSINTFYPVLDSEQLQSRQLWLLSSCSPPRQPRILLLEKVKDGQFRRIGYSHSYRAFEDDEWKRFKVVEFTLV
ncbi:hypothetical protein S40285_04634 [Stachybotrys chlorohalonatus IBT 40285]|uniref:Heterokaryon incompatibility domain-containing protein n=1 Tax=Stachybotrys chlorohalonatus (strain IBT 40285) TaxID=1283841 RepID=A0A084QZQ2_STAC4|nr:hypothetical protein S40285_04634 [Stachybotrys chlorohalonata IBT 40285]